MKEAADAASQKLNAEIMDFFKPNLLTAKVIHLPLSLLSFPDKDIESRRLIPAQVEAVKLKLRTGWSAGHNLVGVAFDAECFRASGARTVNPLTVSMSDAEIAKRLEESKVRVQIISGSHRLKAMNEMVTEDIGEYSAMFKLIPVTVYLFDKKTPTIRENVVAFGNLQNDQHVGQSNSWEQRILFMRKEFEGQFEEKKSKEDDWESFCKTINITAACAKFARMMLQAENYLRQSVRFALMDRAPWSLVQKQLEKNIDIKVKKQQSEGSGGRGRGSGAQDKGVAEHNLCHVLSLPPQEQTNVLSDIVAGRVTGTAIQTKCELNRASGVLCGFIPSYLGLKSWQECCLKYPNFFNSAFIQLWMSPTRNIILSLPGKFRSVNKLSFDDVCPPGLKPELDLIKATLSGPQQPLQPSPEQLGTAKLFQPAHFSADSMTALLQDQSALARVSVCCASVLHIYVICH